MRINKNIRRVIASILVATMVFANEGMIALAESNPIENVELIQDKEEIAEESEVEEVKVEEVEESEEAKEETIVETEEVRKDVTENEGNEDEITEEKASEETKEIEEDEVSPEVEESEESEEETEYEEEPEEDVVEETTTNISNAEEEEETEEETVEVVEETTLIEEDEESIIGETVEEIIAETTESETFEDLEKDVEVATESEIEELEEGEFEAEEVKEVLGVVDFKQDILFDCGKGPGLEHTNFASLLTAGKITKVAGTNTYRIAAGGQGVNIINYLGITDPSMILDYGSGNHVKVPKFNNEDTLWSGYKNPKWKYEDGTEARCLEFATGYTTGDTIYTAEWEKDPNYKITAKVSYLREGAAPTDRKMTSDYVKGPVAPGTFITLSEKDIPGYSIVDKKYEFNDGGTIITEKEKVFKDKNFDGTYSDTETPLDFNTENQLQGALPNHDFTLSYICAPDMTKAKNLIIKYWDATNSVAVDTTQTTPTKAEDVIDIVPPAITNYEFVKATIEGGDNESDNTGLYKLGTYPVDGQTTYWDDPTKLGPDITGHFKAKMPNQNLTITFYYNKISSGADVKCIYKFEGREDIEITKHGVIGETLCFEPTGRPTGIDFKAYGIPSCNVSGTGLTIDSAAWNTDITPNPDGTANENRGRIYVTLTSDAPKTITISYAYDYTSTEYWQNIAFTNSSNGHLEVATGSPSITDRFISVGTHPFSEFIQGINVVPDTNYILDGWYRGKDEGVGKRNDDAEPKLLPTTAINVTTDSADPDQVVDHKYVLFANFIKDPAMFANVIFELEDETHARFNSTALNIEIQAPFDWNSPTPILFPEVIVDGGYELKGWRLSTDTTVYNTPGNAAETAAGTAFKAAYPTPVNMTIVAVVEEKEVDDGVCHMPVGELTTGADGVGSVTLYGINEKRKYVLADRNGVVISIKDSTAAAAGFNNLLPGTQYKLYEVTTDVALVAGTDNVSTVDSAKIGAAKDVYVPAIKSSTVTGNGVDGFNITFTRKTGIQYALLKKDYTLERGFNANPDFTGLTDADYYIVIAKDASDTTITDSDFSACITQGVIVHMEKHDVSNKKYRLVLNTGASIPGRTADETAGANVYYLSAGDTVTAMGMPTSGAATSKWSVDSNNINLANPSQQTINFAMPAEDVYLTCTPVEELPSNHNSKIKIINNSGAKVGVRDQYTLLNDFNTDVTSILSNMGGVTLDDGLEVVYYIIFDRVGRNDANYPYGIKMNLAASVNGKLAKWDNASSHNVKVVHLLDKEILKNIEYEYLNGTAGGYDVTSTEEKKTEVGSMYATMSGDGTTEISAKCKKTHTLTIKAEGINGFTFSEKYDVKDGEAVSTITGDISNTKLKDIIQETATQLDGRYVYKDDTSSTAVSQFNTVIYNYEGLYNGSTALTDGTATIIDKTITYTMKFTRDTERDTNKNTLKNKIQEATNKLTTPVGLLPVNQTSLNDIIALATVTMNTQDVKTNAELLAQIADIQNVLDNLVTTVNINLDGNGGDVSATVIVATISQAFSSLRGITGTNGDMFLNHWNTDSGDAGDVIDASTVIDHTYNDSTIFAIWSSTEPEEDDPEPTPNPKPSKKSGGGGGGGGTAGNSGGRTSIAERTNSTIGPIFEPSIIVSLSKDKVKLSTNDDMKDRGHDGTLFTYYDQYAGTNLYYIRGDYTFVEDSWITINFNGKEDSTLKGSQATYHFDKSGKANVGLFTEGNDVYYFNKEYNNTFGQLKTGWIYDSQANKWYYADKQNGTLKTGWQFIDGNLYYFNTYGARDDKGNLDVNNLNYGNGYGQLFTNTTTPDGYLVDSNGIAVVKQD